MGPFYGYIYGGVAAGNHHGLYSSGDWEYHFDPQTKVPYIYSASKQQFVSFDDVHSLAEKTSYVKEQNLKGVMIWDLSSDRDFDLLTALTAELQDCTSTNPK